MLKRRPHNILALTLIISSTLPTGLYASLPDSYVSARLQSDYAQEIHRALFQQMLLEDITAASPIELIEQNINSRQSRILLKTAVRNVHTLSFDKTRTKWHVKASDFANELLQAALSAGVVYKK